jgi:hypothetical protein
MAKAEVWKEEFHVIAEDGEAREWLDSMAEAREALKPDDKRIDKVTYYLNDTETVWERADEDSCPNGEHCCCECETCCDCQKPRNP